MDTSTWVAPLAGQTILVTEYEAPISFRIGTSLKEAGANVVTAKDQRAAVLDTRQGSGAVDLICWCLDRRSVPFLFLAEDSSTVVKQWAPAPSLSKSSEGRALIDGVISILITDGNTFDQLPTNYGARRCHLFKDAASHLSSSCWELTSTGQYAKSAEELLRLMREAFD